jgi:hypothetical protein
VLVVKLNKNTIKMEMSIEIKILRKTKNLILNLHTPQCELLLRIVLKYSTSPSGHNQRCQNQLSTITLNPTKGKHEFRKKNKYFTNS